MKMKKSAAKGRKRRGKCVKSKLASDRTPIAYGYIRMSTLHQELSPEIQKEQIEWYYKSRLEPKGYRWGKIFFDAATTARTHFRERPAGHDLYMRLEVGDAVIIQRPDRLCRRHSDSVRLIEDWIDRDITIYATQWNMDTEKKAYGKLVFGIMGSMSEWENETRAERVREAMQYLKSKGLPVSSHPGWGNKWEGYKCVPCERDQRLMHSLVKWVEKGWNLRVIANHLHQHGIFNRKWNRQYGRKGGIWQFRWIEWNPNSLQKMYNAALQREADKKPKPSGGLGKAASTDALNGVAGAETILAESAQQLDQTVDKYGRVGPASLDFLDD